MKKLIMPFFLILSFHSFAQISYLTGMNAVGSFIVERTTMPMVDSTGSYTDLINKPTALSQFTNDVGFIVGTKGKADNTTFGIDTYDSTYFKDNGAGLIKFSPTSGTGTVSSGAVTINEPKGKITLTSPSILANANLSITLTNSFITPTSIINLGINGSGSAISIGLNCYVKSQTTGSCVINLLNLSLLTTFSTGVVIDYFIVN